MQCRNCGHSVSCGGCDVPLTYHRATQRLMCHYCGRRRRVPDNCPECLAYRLSFYGIGTQSVADHLAELFPQAKVIRWDSDATRYPREYEEVLTKFRNRDADVLVGTQMIAKGLHLPGVTLVGVVLADIGLAIPDYRSGERTFQLLCQVAGRAGRGDDPGSVVLQTYQPDNYAIKAAAAQDYQSFYMAEMRHRHEHGKPALLATDPPVALAHQQRGLRVEGKGVGRNTASGAAERGPYEHRRAGAYAAVSAKTSGQVSVAHSFEGT